jgi:hypothetical protein
MRVTRVLAVVTTIVTGSKGVVKFRKPSGSKGFSLTV